MDNIRYIKLHNNGAFVVRIQIQYKKQHTDGQGNVSYDAEWNTWKPSGYHDICAAAERTVDLCKDANLPDNSIVRLKAEVVLGKDRTSTDEYMYNSANSEMAVYKIGGAVDTSKLEFVSVG